MRRSPSKQQQVSIGLSAAPYLREAKDDRVGAQIAAPMFCDADRGVVSISKPQMGLNPDRNETVI